MKVIGRLVVVVLIGLVAGCDTRTAVEVYRTDEGLGILGPSGGYFWCDDETDCAGTPG